MADDSRWVTIVVRAWPDVDGVRARLLLAADDGARRHRAVASVDEAAATVERWLRALHGTDESDDAEPHRDARCEPGPPDSAGPPRPGGGRSRRDGAGTRAETGRRRSR